MSQSQQAAMATCTGRGSPIGPTNRMQHIAFVLEAGPQVQRGVETFVQVLDEMHCVGCDPRGSESDSRASCSASGRFVATEPFASPKFPPTGEAWKAPEGA